MSVPSITASARIAALLPIAGKKGRDVAAARPAGRHKKAT